MARLIFLPIADRIESGTYLLYDGACGTGGMLTVAEETLQHLAGQHGKQVATHLYGQEINAETYAICKADLLLKGEGDAADNIIGGPEHSTLSNDAFPSREFDFMLSNPPYGKSWKSDLERMGGKGGIKDPRFVIEHEGDAEYSLITRSSDGQLLFLANMISKMKHGTPLGSRIAEVHNGSSLSTGDAGQGESNIRRWIIENDWLEAIVALPLNLFYNTRANISMNASVLMDSSPETPTSVKFPKTTPTRSSPRTAGWPQRTASSPPNFAASRITTSDAATAATGSACATPSVTQLKANPDGQLMTGNMSQDFAPAGRCGERRMDEPDVRVGLREVAPHSPFRGLEILRE
jgi:hypothetical protein